MSVLDHENILSNASLEGRFRDFPKEWNKLAKFAYFRKLMLEEFPNVMGLQIICLPWSKQYLVFHAFVKQFRIRGEVSHFGTLQVPVNNSLMLREYFE